MATSSVPVSGARSALVLSLLVLVAVVAHRDALLSSAALGDERAYVCAAHAVLEARELTSCPAYLYGPALAHASAQVLAHGGETALLGVLRGAVWLGAAVTLWLSLGRTSFRFWPRVLIGAAALVVWPPITQSLSLGNLSSATSALTVAAILAIPRHALLAGALLACAIVVKPLPAAVPVVLVAAALGAWLRQRRLELPTLLAGVSSGVCVLLVFALAGGLPSSPVFDRRAENPITLVRALDALGWSVPPLATFVAVVLGGAWLAARRHFPPLELGLLAIVVSLLSSPLVWCHTWLLATPLLLLALDRSISAYRLRAAGSTERASALLRLLGVVLATLCVSVSDAFGAVGHGTAVSAIFIAFPLFAPCALLRLWRLAT